MTQRNLPTFAQKTVFWEYTNWPYGALFSRLFEREGREARSPERIELEPAPDEPVSVEGVQFLKVAVVGWHQRPMLSERLLARARRWR